ncbi:DUF1579 domain-containing protein [Dyadobacter chenwenxiniae]|uniref:DUF1579 domain-containing protein n=1 Tax=Dyadobacter chenwenxiniae TaxID=2906456 RepID=A0A9X1PK34_9BACT|nr:DUF1579 domain-containing protein [Dyadobacter chenwenxiniae]MCF0061454.1 DUF1579 domain-containing protein [Dyadobacter chenwenxiniae]UON81277.1 DUF1579 domain-containing protein [Dyadobacter chenwenxiniae]
MSKSKFEISLESGVHQQLQSLIGNWKGTTKTWFEPGVLADESPMEGTIRSILGGRFVLHEYKGSLTDQSFEGIAIYGYDVPNNNFQSAWIDSIHMGTRIMLSSGAPTASGFSVLGSYGGPDIPAPWGWRTTVVLPDNDNLIITAYNISPEGQEDKATETVYKRIG